MDKTQPAYGVYTQSRVPALNYASLPGALSVPTNPSLVGDTHSQLP